MTIASLNYSYFEASLLNKCDGVVIVMSSMQISCRYVYFQYTDRWRYYIC